MHHEIDEGGLAFEEPFIGHAPGKSGKSGNVYCITLPVERRDKKFFMDSGSGHDLMSQRQVDRMGMDTYRGENINFHTANSVSSSEDMIKLGKRCMEQGYSFI